jgi:hypothetical protein
MGIAYNPSIVTNGLVLALDAGNTKSYPGSGTTWTDLSGNGRNGTLTNGPTYSSSDGGSIVFDGVDDHVQCSGSISIGRTGTFVAWIKRNADLNGGIIFSNGVTYDAGIKVSLSGDLRYTWSFPGLAQGEFGWNSGLIIPDLTWCMCAVSVTLSSATAYLCQSSGITSATNTVASHPSIILDNIRVGDDTTNGGDFTGNIAIAQIYNRALSATEIQQNFNAIRGRFGI